MNNYRNTQLQGDVMLGKYFKFTIIILLLICMSSCGKRENKIMDESNEILKKVSMN